MDKQNIADVFMRGQDCSQVVVSHYAGELGIDEEELNKISAAFGGGFGAGEACGAIIGAMMVIGLKYGHKGVDDFEQRDIMGAKRADFLSMWNERREARACRDLLGHDVSLPGEFEKVLEEGLLTDFCPDLVIDAIEILDKIIAEDSHENEEDRLEITEGCHAIT